MWIRECAPEDIEQIVHLFYNTVHQVNCQDYTLAQVNAWAPTVSDVAVWARRCADMRVFVADDQGAIAGFAELEVNGHIDCFYCHHHYQRRGVGSQLYQRLEQAALELNLRRLWVEVSITARPFFERMGFEFLHENQVMRNHEKLINFSMAKDLTQE